MESNLEILYQDEHIIAVNKPHGMLVHKSRIAKDETVFVLQTLKNQINKWVIPANRLDRQTGGVLLFSLNENTDKLLKKMFAENKISKTYLCLVRGFPPISGTINHDLMKENGNIQNATTEFETILNFELPIEVSRYPQSRYSIVKAHPITGRFHQIRRHFAKERYYIIGDKPHGECKQNKMYEQRFELNTMLLHCYELIFEHPISNEKLKIRAKLQAPFTSTIKKIDVEFELNIYETLMSEIT